jgi:hypothetical protein
MRSLLVIALYVLLRVKMGFDWFYMIFSFSRSLAFNVIERNRFLSFLIYNTLYPLAKWSLRQRFNELRLVLIEPLELLNNRLFTYNAS